MNTGILNEKIESHSYVTAKSNDFTHNCEKNHDYLKTEQLQIIIIVGTVEQKLIDSLCIVDRVILVRLLVALNAFKNTNSCI